ncbi:MAG: hypothetical protein WCP39_07850, partial [Chlamydiota bacterium]
MIPFLCWEVDFMRSFFIFLMIALEMYAAPLALFPAFEGNSSGWIEGCVDSITGCYREQVIDYIVDGPDPLFIERSYTNRDYKTGKQEGSWAFFPHCTLVVGDSNEGKKGYTASPKGGYLPLSIQKNFPAGKIHINDCNGITNCSQTISGQTHPRNILLKSIEEGYEIITGNGTKRTYVKQKTFTEENWNFFGESFYQSCAKEIQNPIYYVLVQEKLPSGNMILYDYNENGLLSSITLSDSEKSTILSWIHLEYSENQIHLKTSDGEEISYFFINGLLTKVHSSSQPNIEYEYDDSLCRNLCKKTDSHRSLEIIYDETFRV